MANFFKKIISDPVHPSIDMSNFDMSHEHKTTMRFGDLVPVLCQEVLPGDKWNIDTSAFVRSMPLLSPMMHKVDLKIRYFFVPNRLIWDKWEAFISGHKPDGQDLFIPTIKFEKGKNLLTQKYAKKGSLMDYFGFCFSPKDPLKHDIEISQLPFRAYDLIYSEYFANQWVNPRVLEMSYQGAKWFNKLPNIVEDLDAANEMVSDLLSIEDVAYEPDYFTSAAPLPNASLQGVTTPSAAVPIRGHSVINETLYPTAGGANVATIPELRQAFRLQEFLENSYRSGMRYIEQLFGHFGVQSSDARLQRPEYLGGGSLAIQVSEVASTSESENIQLGDLAGRGIAVGNIPDITLTSEEHGYLFGIAYIVPQTSYYGGIPRTFLRHERFDFAFPEFASLGEQPLYRRELDLDAPDNDIFGYVPRYSEYKQCMDKFSGEMVDTLAFWHLGRDLRNTDPRLNSDFVYLRENSRKVLNRVFNVTDPQTHTFQASFGFQSNALRPLPFNPTKLG